jgi:iron complex outermembrane receptor protein
MKRIFLLVLFILPLANPDAFAFQVRSSAIRGKITDTSGNPMSGAGVTIENTFLGTYSDENGDYSFTGLKDGLYNIRFSYTGYNSRVYEVTLSGEKLLDVILAEQSFSTGEVIVSSIRAGSHTPLAYTTLDSELISRQNIGQDIPFLLSLTPSLVETSEAGNGFGYTNLRIRGTDASRINVTIDGIPLNDPESQQVFWVDIPDIASSVDNIQVQRGAGTSSNGAGAFGATVSLQTKNPENEPFAQISGSYGSFNSSKRMIAAGTGLIAGRLAFQLRYSELNSDGYIDRTGSVNQSAYFSGVFRNKRTQLKANIIIGGEHTGIGWWGVPKEMLSVNRRYNPAGEYTDETGTTHFYSNESDNYIQNHYQFFYGVKLAEKLNFNSAFHYTQGKGYYEEYKEDGQLSEYGLPDVSTGDTIISESDLIRRKWLSNNFYGAVFSIKYREKRVEATIGGGINNYLGDHYGRIIWMKYAGATKNDFQWYLNKGAKTDISIYGKADYTVTRKISAFADLQFRHISYFMRGNDDDLKDLRMNQSYDFFNPKAGIFVSLTPSQDAYLSFSVANREPTRADFKEASGDPEATPKPERLYDTEFGYKLKGEKISAGFNLYGMLYKDQLVPTGELSSTGYSIMTNVARSHRLGVEISTGIKPLSFFSWDINLTLSRNKIRDFVEYYNDYDTISWTLTYRSKNLGSVDIAYSPSVTGNSDMAFKFLRIGKLHFISKYVGDQYFDNTMSTDRKLDPYFVSNVRIDFEPEIPGIKNAEFQVLINNIFNSMYLSNAYGGSWYEAGIEKSWSYYFPQAGINWMFRISLTF